MEKIENLDAAQRKKLLQLLRKYEYLFDGTLGDFNTPPVQLVLKEGVHPLNSRAFPVPHVHKKTLLKEILRMESLGILKKHSDL